MVFGAGDVEGTREVAQLERGAGVLRARHVHVLGALRAGYRHARRRLERRQRLAERAGTETRKVSFGSEH